MLSRFLSVLEFYLTLSWFISTFLFPLHLFRHIFNFVLKKVSSLKPSPPINYCELVPYLWTALTKSWYFWLALCAATTFFLNFSSPPSLLKLTSRETSCLFLRLAR